MKPVALQVHSVGRYLPERVVTAPEMDELLGVPAGWVIRKTGVAERHWINGETPLEMAVLAVEDAAQKADVSLNDVDLLLWAATSPQQLIPDTAPLLQRELGLGASGVKSYSVHSTCLSFLAALDIAAGYIATGRHHNVLIASAELTSTVIDVREPESAALLGDMATAVFVTATPDGAASELKSLAFATFGDGADLCRIEGGGAAKHPNDPSTKPEDLLFHMDGPEVFRLAFRAFPSVLEEAFADTGLTVDDLDVVVPHQASLLAVRSIHHALGIPDDKVIINLDRVGNCVAASLPGALYDAIQDQRVARGDTVMLAGTGAGVSLAIALLTW